MQATPQHHNSIYICPPQFTISTQFNPDPNIFSPSNQIVYRLPTSITDNQYKPRKLLFLFFSAYLSLNLMIKNLLTQ